MSPDTGLKACSPCGAEGARTAYVRLFPSLHLLSFGRAHYFVLNLVILSFKEKLKMSSLPNAVEKLELPARANGWTKMVMSALFVALMGIGLVYGAGFADVSVLHNAAHDARHSAGFPCH